MISYWIILSLIIIFSIVIILTRYNIILKNSQIGYFIRSNVFKYIMKRILLCFSSIFLILVAVFLLMRMMPKDYFYSYNENNYNFHNASFINSNNIFKDFINYFYNILPFPKRICTSSYLENGNIVCGNYEYKIINLGYSYVYMKNISVWTIIKEKCGVSFLIGSIAYILQCLIGYPLGIYMARKANKKVDKAINFTRTLIGSIPEIVYFYLFLLLFMIVLKLPVSFDINDSLSYLAPLCSLVFFGSLTSAYWVKRYILLESKKDYVKFALSKGMDEGTVFYKHVVKNALIPLIRTIPTTLAQCVSGYYLLEATFNIPGIGLTLISAINLQDVYLVQGLILFFSFLSVFAHLLGDLISLLLDKRVCYTSEVKNNEK